MLKDLFKCLCFFGKCFTYLAKMEIRLYFTEELEEQLLHLERTELTSETSESEVFFVVSSLRQFNVLDSFFYTDIEFAFSVFYISDFVFMPSKLSSWGKHIDSAIKILCKQFILSKTSFKMLLFFLQTIGPSANKYFSCKADKVLLSSSLSIA